MRAGQHVTFVDTHGKRHVATITAVSGTGASGRKMLDLEYQGGKAELVAHEGDQAKRAGYWQMRAPDQDAATEAAFEAGALPEADRREGVAAGSGAAAPAPRKKAKSRKAAP